MTHPRQTSWTPQGRVGQRADRDLPADRGRVLVFQNLFVARSTISSSTFDSIFRSHYLCETALSLFTTLNQDAGTVWSMNNKNTGFTCAEVIMNALSVSYRMMHSVMRQLRDRKINEKHLVIMVNYFIL